MGVQTASERNALASRAHHAGSAKTERLNIRVTDSEKALVERAARASHTSASQFVVQAAVRSAADVLADRTRFSLPADEWAAFVAVLDRPARVVPALREAAAKRRPFSEP